MQWNLLCERIHSGYCVPFLGAGVNVGKPDKYEGLPAAAGVVKSLVEELLGRRVESLESLAKVEADAALEQQFADLCRPGLHNLARVAGPKHRSPKLRPRDRTRHRERGRGWISRST